MRFEEVREGMFLYTVERGGNIMHVIDKRENEIEFDYIKKRGLQRSSTFIMRKNSFNKRAEERSIIDVRESPGTMMMTIRSILK
jgi:hypothetical protein